jgi:imidazolonepropionase-like amidohydrolase
VTSILVRAPAGWLGSGPPEQDVVVQLDGPTVTYAGPAAGWTPSAVDRELDIDGFVLPGVVDRHVHIGLSDPAAVVAGGTTAVRDLGWPSHVVHPLAAASEDPAFDGPYIRAAGPILTCPGGYPTRAGWGPEGTGLEVRGTEQAAAEALRLLREGTAGVVKVAMNADAGPVLEDDELAAVCDAVHGQGAMVTAHVQGPGQAARALALGVDEFAHCPWSERLPDELIQAAAARMRIVSTLDIHSYGRDTPELRVALDNLRRFVGAEGRVAYGTDLGNGPIPPGIHHGEAMHLAAAGLAPHAVLAAMTFRPLAPGEPADLVVLGADPFQDLDALRHVVMVVKRGRRVG